MDYKTIEIQTGQGVAVLWLNRPEVRNAFNETMIAELTSAFGELEAHPGVRAVVLAGHGKVFCAGADLNWMKKIAELGLDENRKDAMAFGAMLNRLHALKKPTVARIHGAAFAGGMGLAAACDIAVASTDTEFCMSEVRLGLSPATVGPYVLAAMGERAAQRYFLTAERFTAAEAYRIGFVQELARPEELDATVNSILGELVQGAPGAHAATKELIRSVARRPIAPELIADMAGRIARARASDEGKEGVHAFLEKRSTVRSPTGRSESVPLKPRKATCAAIASSTPRRARGPKPSTPVTVSSRRTRSSPRAASAPASPLSGHRQPQFARWATSPRRRRSWERPGCRSCPAITEAIRRPTSWGRKPGASVFRSLSSLVPAAAAKACAWSSAKEISTRRSPRAGARPCRPSATSACCSKNISSGRGTSRSRSSPTGTAAAFRCSSATARCSGAIRKCSRRRRRPA